MRGANEARARRPRAHVSRRGCVRVLVANIDLRRELRAGRAGDASERLAVRGTLLHAPGARQRVQRSGRRRRDVHVGARVRRRARHGGGHGVLVGDVDRDGRRVPARRRRRRPRMSGRAAGPGRGVHGDERHVRVRHRVPGVLVRRGQLVRHRRERDGDVRRRQMADDAALVLRIKVSERATASGPRRSARRRSRACWRPTPGPRARGG